MQDLSSTVTFSPSFSFYVSSDVNLIATAVRVANESVQSYTVEDYSVKVNGDEDEDFEFETLMPLEDKSNDVDDDVAKNLFYGRWNIPPSQSNSSSDSYESENLSESSNYCFWSPVRSPAREGRSKSTVSSSSASKRCRFKELLKRSHSGGSDGVVSPPSGSKLCRFKDLLRRSHSDGSDGSPISPRRSSQVEKGKAKTASYKSTLNIGEIDKRRKSYLPYRQDLIGVFAGMSRLRHQ